MIDKLLPDVEEYLARRQRHNIWLRIMGFLGCVVVFCTTYALILPAITLEKEPVCGLEEHTHTDSCYVQVPEEPESVLVCSRETLGVHTHDAACFDQTGAVICGYADFVIHTAHDSRCFDASGNLVCPLPEVEAHVHTAECYAPAAEEPVHVHSDECYDVRQGGLICQKEETEGHTHGAACYETSSALICGLEESADHVHTEACRQETSTLVCPLEESEGHRHSDACYDQERVLICQLSTEPAEAAEPAEPRLICGKQAAMPHTHTAACYTGGVLTCGQLETLAHQHTDACFQTVGTSTGPQELTCPLEEGEEHQHTARCYGRWELACGLEEHTHTEACWTAEETPDTPEYLCGLEEHVHSEDCYDETGHLACGLEAHTHTEACTSPEGPAPAAGDLSYSGPDYTVRVRYGVEAGLPEGVTLEVLEIQKRTAAYRSYYDQALDALAAQNTAIPGTLVFARFFDVRFLLDGQTLEPAAPVSVTITYAEAVEASGSASCQAIHFAEDGPELLDVDMETKHTGETSFTHTQDSFSVVGDLVTMSYSDNSTDVGESPLPVDYYVCIDGSWVCVGTTKTGWYGDYNASGWTDTNRDYITVAQVESILGPYGFHASDGAGLNKKVAYQQKSGNTAIYADVNTPTTFKGMSIVPLSRNADHPGYNLYYVPGNYESFSGVSYTDLNKTAHGFYTVKVYDSNGQPLTSQVVRTGGGFTYNAAASGVTSWLAVYGDGSTKTIDGSTITITNITTPVTISPQLITDTLVNHGVTFKVCIDGKWETVGSLPYYYSGRVNGQQRAYITSDMAAQFFGDYGYTATQAPGYHFGYSYNDIYEIYYDQSNFCMDVKNGSIQANTVIQLYAANHSDAQTFRIWEAEAGYYYITPVTNSGLHINDYLANTGNGATILLHPATDAASQWKMQEERNGTVSFWARNAPDSACIDLDGGTTVNGTKIHIWNGTENRYWRLNQVFRISNNTVSEAISGGRYKIGLTEESNGAIVCYYMPGETTNRVTNASESSAMENNRFWSITVRDDTHSVYSEGELSAMRWVAREGSTASTEIRVRNGDGVVWSCVGKGGDEGVPVKRPIVSEGGYTIFDFLGANQPIEIVATKVDPSFTVQYYANIDRPVLGENGNLDLIDTSGGHLPQNTSNQSLLWLTLEDTGRSTNQNRGNQTSLHRVKTEKQLTQMYADGTFNFEQHPGLKYFDKLWGQSNYKLDAVLVLKDGRSPDSTNDDDWWWYQVNQDTWSNIKFTNVASDEYAPRQEGVKQGRDGNYCILLQEGTVLRLRYETNNQSYTNQASFHDYDITSGMNSDGTWRSGVTGINTDSNYVTSGNGQRKFTWNGVGSSTADVFAFGNQNCETGMGLAQWGGNNINAYNYTTPVMEDGSSNTPFGNKVYKGCTFGLVKSLDGSGNLIWNEWITHPNLFNEGGATGKHSYNNGSLRFNQTGDTYTLTAANSTVGSRDNLEYFFHPSPSSDTTYDRIFTNNFWPMDSATDKTDPLMGAWGHPTNTANGVCDIQVNGFWDAQNQVGGGHNHVNLPLSDDGQAHNWFFGMNFSISFTLTEDYLGPLEYLFFGDDDMWVFLDGRLMCDIGGVHSSVGEYVNLRDYLPVGSSGQHTLSFFYTERGASGSTCWMQFTLPSVSSAVTGRDTGSLQIAKSVSGADGLDLSNVEYEFEVELLTGENGSPMNEIYSYETIDAAGHHETYGNINHGGTIKLRPGWTATIKGIPAGTYYRVTELTRGGYHVAANGTEGYIVSGTVETGSTKPASFVNTPYCELPQTGGAGTALYTFSGLGLMAGTLVYSIHRRRKGAAKHF